MESSGRRASALHLAAAGAPSHRPTCSIRASQRVADRLGDRDGGWGLMSDRDGAMGNPAAKRARGPTAQGGWRMAWRRMGKRATCLLRAGARGQQPGDLVCVLEWMAGRAAEQRGALLDAATTVKSSEVSASVQLSQRGKAKGRIGEGLKRAGPRSDSVILQRHWLPTAKPRPPCKRGSVGARLPRPAPIGCWAGAAEANLFAAAGAHRHIPMRAMPDRAAAVCRGCDRRAAAAAAAARWRRGRRCVEVE